jgi:hypothetical protein
VDFVEMNAGERLKKLEEHRQSQLRTIKRYEDMPETSVFKRNRAVSNGSWTSSTRTCGRSSTRSGWQKPEKGRKAWRD